LHLPQSTGQESHVSFWLHLPSPHISGGRKIVRVTMPVAVIRLWFSGGLFISIPHDQFSSHEKALLLGLALGEVSVWAETIEEETAIPISERAKIAIIMATGLGKKFTLFYIYLKSYKS
jgi:hypothetical protein